MRLLLFAGKDAESEKAKRLLLQVAPKFPELQLMKFPAGSDEAKSYGIVLAPAIVIDGRKVCEGTAPSYSELISMLSARRQPASKALSEEPAECDETFE